MIEFKDENTRQRLLDAVRFNADGLVCAIAQDHDSKEILMVAWMNREALDETFKSYIILVHVRPFGAKANPLVKHSN